MGKIRHYVGVIQLFLVMSFINSALGHYAPQDVNNINTGNSSLGRFRRGLQENKNVCEAMAKIKYGAQIGSAIPTIGPIFLGLIQFTNMAISRTALDTSCDDIPFEKMKKLMRERFDQAHAKVDSNFVTIQQLDAEINHLFDQYSNKIQNSRVREELSEVKTFIKEFSSSHSNVDRYLENQNFAGIERMLAYLTKDTRPTGGRLTTQVNNIITKNLAIREDGDDVSGILAFYALYYGVQSYVSAMLFLLDKHSLLAKYYYHNGEFAKYNEHLLAMPVVYNIIRTLSSTNYQNHVDNNRFNIDFESRNDLVDAFFSTGRLAVRKIELQRRDSDKPTIDSMLEKIEAMNITNKVIAETVLPMLEESPHLVKITMSPEKVGRLRKIGTTDQVSAQYAIQFKRKDLYSVVSGWTRGYKIGEKKYASITLPTATVGTTRLVFRKLSSEKPPELVAVIRNPKQTVLNDIHRDLYNVAASTSGGSKEIIPRLIQNGADINAIFDQGWSLLHAAAKANNVEAATIFLQNRDVNINVQDDNGYTPLHVAGEFGNNQFAELLIRKGTDINKKTKGKGLTPLHIAAVNGQKSIVQLLMKSRGININLGDTKGDTPLHYAANKSHSVVQAMIANSNVDVNARNNDGFTPLHYAVSSNDRNVVSVLLSNQKVNVNVLSNNKLSPLHLAAIYNLGDIAKLLLSNNWVNVNLEGPDDYRPIHFAVVAGHKNFVELLVNKNANLNARSRTRWTPLHFAVMARESGIVSLLLRSKSQDFDVNPKTDDGYTPLHMAVATGQHDVIEELIRAGAQLEAKTNEGLTPLHVSAMHNNMQVVNILISRGANKQAKTPQGKLFWELALEKGTLEVVKIKLPANLNTEEKKRILNDAAVNGNHKVLKYLFDEKKCDWDMEYVLILLSTSINNNHTSTSQYLIDSFYTVGMLPVPPAFLKDHFVAAARVGNLDIMKHMVNRPEWKLVPAELKKIWMSIQASYYDKFGAPKARSALQEAIYAGNRQVIYYLMSYGVTFIQMDERYKLAYEVAEEKGLMDVYGMLIMTHTCNKIIESQYAKMHDHALLFINSTCYDYKQNFYSYPLNVAIDYDDNDIKYDLVREGADVNTLDGNRNTPLHLALIRKRDILTRNILKRNPDVRIKNVKGKKPIDVAREVGAPQDIISDIITKEREQNKKDGFPTTDN